MTKTFGYPELMLIVGAEQSSYPFAEMGGGFAQIDGDIKNLPLDDAYQFTLRLLRLVVQTSQYAFSRTRMIVLYEVHCTPDDFFENSVIKTLEKETTIVAKHLGLEQDYFRDREGSGIHQ